jgi:hypothetical protein
LNKLTAAAGAAALCVLGLSAAAGTHYLTISSHPLSTAASSRAVNSAAASRPLEAGNAASAATTATSASVSAVTTFTGGTSIISGNGDYQLLMQTNGDLVENSLHGISPIEMSYIGGVGYNGGGNVDAEGDYDDGDAVAGTYVGEDVTQIWQSNTGGNPGARAVLQQDGNFVVYSESNAVLWSSNTGGNPGAALSVQNDGNAVLYDNGRALWASKTVSIVSGGDSPTVNFRTCPGVTGDDCANPTTLSNGTGVTMLCWESVPAQGWGTNPPSNKWFYSVLDGSQQSLGYLNASVVEPQTQIKTPPCAGAAGIGQLPPVPALPTVVPPSTTTPPSATSTSPGKTAPASGGQPPSSGGSSTGGSTQPSSGSPSTGATTPPPNNGNPPPGTGSGGTYTETVGGPTHTWTDYSDAGGSEGATIPTGQSVQVTCVVQGFKVADGNTNWYQIASSPWSNAYYASSDAFFNNGATSGSLDGTPYVDPNVPAC